MGRSYEIRQNFFTLNYLSCRFEQNRRGEGRGLPLWETYNWDTTVAFCRLFFDAGDAGKEAGKQSILHLICAV